MRECCVVTTYKRPELLHCCLKRIRAAEPGIEIIIFPDRGTARDPETILAVRDFKRGNLQVNFVPDHDYHGNSYNVMEALRWAYNEGSTRIFYIEDDVMVHPDFFTWHRAQHELIPDLFASMAWIFNRHAPIVDDLLFQPWYYAIGTCFPREKLGLIVEHASPRYYEDMQSYIEKTFKGSQLNTPFGIQHYEQDGLIQRVLDADRSQTISPGITKCSHMGMYGYNRGWKTGSDLFDGALDFEERIRRLEDFISDPYARATIFGREIIEREIGRELPRRSFVYRVELPQGWTTEFTSELTMNKLPRKINSVLLGKDAKISLL
jgi:hypothetical protein